MLARIREAGIGDRDIRTSGAQISPEREGDKGRRLRGFNARQSIELRLRELVGFGELLTTLAGSGADELEDAVFFVDAPSTLEPGALKAAMADPGAKAEALADAVGVRLGDVLFVREAEGELEGPMPAARHVLIAESNAHLTTPVAAGGQAITAMVTVRFVLR